MKSVESTHSFTDTHIHSQKAKLVHAHLHVHRVREPSKQGQTENRRAVFPFFKKGKLDLQSVRLLFYIVIDCTEVTYEQKRKIKPEVKKK